VCRGARFAEGPVLASLAMLARKFALRVAPGGSAPLFLSAARHGSGGARSGRESRLANRTGKPVWGATRLTMRRADGSILMRQCPISSGTFLDEAIRGASRLSRNTLRTVARETESVRTISLIGRCRSKKARRIWPILSTAIILSNPSRPTLANGKEH